MCRECIKMISYLIINLTVIECYHLNFIVILIFMSYILASSSTLPVHICRYSIAELKAFEKI